MPFALTIIGLFLLIAGVRNTQDQLFTLVHGDFTGSDNFIFWFLAILLIGAIGYVDKLKPLSTAFLVLIVSVLFLKKGSSTGIGGGFFAQFLSGIQSATSGSSSNSNTSSLSEASSQNTALLNSIRQQLSSNLAAESSLQTADQNSTMAPVGGSVTGVIR